MISPLVALDLGSTKIACAVGLPHERATGVELLGSSVAVSGSSEGWWSDPLKLGRAIDHALEASQVRDTLQRTVVAITHAALVSERVRVSISLGEEPMTIRARDLERLQAVALDRVLAIDREPLLVERLSCSGNGFDGVRDPRGLSASRLAATFHVLTMPVSLRRVIEQAVESAGLDVERITCILPAALASHPDRAPERGRTLLIDVGGMTTSLGLFIDGVLQLVQVLPWGGMPLATEIATTLQVTMEQATTWSLEGVACRKPEIRPLLERQWEQLQQASEAILKNQPRPESVLLSGRGSLIDGFAEWVERTLHVPVSLCRHPRVSRLGDVGKQLALSPAIGLLELMTRTSDELPARSPHFFNRLIDQTRTILTEYF